MTSRDAQLLVKICVLVVVIFGLMNFGSATDFEKNRSKRSWPLLFTNTSTTTFICGFGVPVHDLSIELVTVGMVLKAPQILPTTLRSLKKLSSHIIGRQAMSELTEYNGTEVFKEAENNTSSKYRIYFYKALEQLSTSLGQNGHICVLKMICEANTVHFHYSNGVFGEILHILFTPSTSHDVYVAAQDYDYAKAEKLGKNGVACESLYQGCSESILERVTRIFE